MDDRQALIDQWWAELGSADRQTARRIATTDTALPTELMGTLTTAGVLPFGAYWPAVEPAPTFLMPDDVREFVARH